MKLLTLLLSTALLLAAPAEAALDVREIMDRVDARDDGDRVTQDIDMLLIDRNKNERRRLLRSYRRDVGEDVQTLLFFISPADVEDTGFLTYDYDGVERDDDQWLYLPALKKTKRIAAGDKSGSFMGSDFNYADLSSRENELYDYELMKVLEVGGHPVWQIQSVPRTKDEIDRTGYEKSVLFIRQDNYVMVRAVHWVNKGGKLRYMDVKRLEQIDGIWTATEIHMTTKKSGQTQHKTVLKNHDTRFNQDLDDDLFTLRSLEKGP